MFLYFLETKVIFAIACLFLPSFKAKSLRYRPGLASIWGVKYYLMQEGSQMRHALNSHLFDH